MNENNNLEGNNLNNNNVIVPNKPISNDTVLNSDIPVNNTEIPVQNVNNTSTTPETNQVNNVTQNNINDIIGEPVINREPVVTNKKSNGAIIIVIVFIILFVIGGIVGAYFALRPSKTNSNSSYSNNTSNNSSNSINNNTNASTNSNTIIEDDEDEETTDEVEEKSFEEKKVDEISAATWKYEKIDLTDLQWVKSERYGNMQIPSSWGLYSDLYDDFETLETPLDAIVYITKDKKNTFIMTDSMAVDVTSIFETYLTRLAKEKDLVEWSQTVQKVGSKNAVIITSKYTDHIESIMYIANQDNSKLIQINFVSVDPDIVDLFKTFTFEN